MSRPLILLALLPLWAGCDRAHHAGEQNERNQCLRELFDEEASIPVEVQGECPLSFGPITIDRQDKDGKGFYQARLPWTLKDQTASLDTYLKERMQRNTHQLSFAIGRISACRLRIDYNHGEPDEPDVPIGARSGGAILDKLGSKGKPTSARVTLASATWYEDAVPAQFLPHVPAEAAVAGRRVIVPVPSNLPLQFDACSLDEAPMYVSWRLTGDMSALAHRVEELCERSAYTAGREVKNIRLLISYRDAYGRPLRLDEDVLLDMTAGQGAFPLRELRSSDPLGSVAVRLVLVTWKERVSQIPLAK